MPKSSRASRSRDPALDHELDALELGRFVTESSTLELLEHLGQLLGAHTRERRCSTYADGTPDPTLVHARAIVLHLRNRTAAGKIVDLDKLSSGSTVLQ